MWESARIHVGRAKKIQKKRTELTIVGVSLAFERRRKVAEVRQNLVGNSIGVFGGEQGNSLARTVAEADKTVIGIYSRNQNIGKAAGQKYNLQAMRIQSHLGL